MVSFQEYVLARFVALNQSIDRLARVISAIDIIAKKHENGLGHWMGGQVGVDLAQEFIEQVEPPVDVPDRVDSYPCRQGRAAPLHHQLLGARQGGSHT